MERLRLTFEKKDALRYTSHLDLQKVWMRVLLRAKLPLAYTQGFHPVPKVGYAWPLPLGWATEGELIDIWLDDPENKPVKSSEFIPRVNACMPPGLRVLGLKKLPVYGDSLTTTIISADYRVVFPKETSGDELKEKTTNLLVQETIMRERRGRSYDLRPLIESIEIHTEGESPVMEIRMAARDSAMGRPDELVSELGFDPFTVSFTRVRYIF